MDRQKDFNRDSSHREKELVEKLVKFLERRFTSWQEKREV